MTTMVDSKIGKTFQRSVGRAKEKLLQNLGKVDRTADEILDEQIGNFNKQQGAATRLQKELNNYIRCIRACAAASRSLLESVGEVYEPEWGGKELLSVNAQSVELLWNDFAHRLAEQVLIPLNTYQFPEVAAKIKKRSRKLIDFDGERHALQALQGNPRRAEAKLGKQREALEAAKRTYEVLNMELHEELPSLYNSRIVFLVSAMSTLFASENIFHAETSKVFTEMEGIVERLSAKGDLNFKVPTNAIMNHTGGPDSPKDEKGGNASSSAGNNSTPSSPVSPSRPTSLKMSTHQNGEQNTSLSPTINKMAEGSNNHVTSNGTHTTNSPPTPTTSTPYTNGMSAENGDEPKLETTQQSPPSADTNNKTSDKMINGVGSGSDDGESTVVKASSVAPVVVAPLSDAEPAPTMDANNNDTIVLKKTDKPADDCNSDTTGSDKLKMDVKVVDATIDNNKGKATEKSKTGVESDDEMNLTATAPVRGVNKPLHGILSQKHANGELSEESPAKEKNNPGVGDSKEPGVLYRVRATYRYQKEDVDELSFEAGEIIRVIEYEEPEEQEEGWLLGIKENGERGMFPANFTRPI
ncbi:myc box-dependent-interacting protein 1 isoform X2 [Folsomia candida]|uniref:myc box-dependent-interacting protein 1 isoform X2 n=1 Tax=Folsomia candida TaxID=158441 RepID=UPI000B8FC88B|nr:myc box-dependent-interacting protein 1 isoform X2 [Folsomia candida]